MLFPAGELAGRPGIALALPVVLIGSRHTANIRISSSKLSKAHALIVRDGGRVFIRDLGSRTGVTVNGAAVREAELRGGELVGLGPFLFEFAAGPALPALGEPGDLPAAFLDVEGGPPVPLRDEQQHARLSRILLIGKRDGADLSLEDDSISTAHAAVFEIDGRRYVRDLGSRAGTLVNGQPVTGLELRFGDVIQVGRIILRYLPAGPADAGMTEIAQSVQADSPDMEPAAPAQRQRPHQETASITVAMFQPPGPQPQIPPVADSLLPPLADAMPPGCGAAPATVQVRLRPVSQDTAMEARMDDVPPLSDRGLDIKPDLISKVVPQAATSALEDDAHVVEVTLPDETTIGPAPEAASSAGPAHGAAAAPEARPAASSPARPVSAVPRQPTPDLDEVVCFEVWGPLAETMAPPPPRAAHTPRRHRTRRKPLRWLVAALVAVGLLAGAALAAIHFGLVPRPGWLPAHVSVNAPRPPSTIPDPRPGITVA
jgi:pSer/pThr/pTyr-binding forkhead associated (FHA) protein